MKNNILIFVITSLFKLLLAYNYDNCSCSSIFKAKVINGDYVEYNKYPFQIAIVDLGYYSKSYFSISTLFTTEEEKLRKFKCAGVIINENHVLTTASCLDNWTKEYIIYNVVVMYGNKNLIKQYDNGYKSIVGFETYETEKPKKREKDIAILEIEPPFEFDEYTKPACFYHEKPIVEYTFTNMTATGWGSTIQVFYIPKRNAYSSYQYTKYLKVTLLNEVYNKNLCLYYNNQPVESLICARNIDPNDHLCYGDTGSPLSYYENGNVFVVGIASIIFSVNNITLCTGYSGFTRIAFYEHWLKSKLNNDICFVTSDFDTIENKLN